MRENLQGLPKHLRQSLDRYGDKPLTFVLLGLTLTVTIVGSALMMFPGHFFSASNSVSGLHPAIRIPLAGVLLMLSVLPVTSMVFAAAYKMEGLKPVRHGLKRSLSVLKTTVGAVMIMAAPMLLVIPGFILMTRFILLLPVMISEKKDGFIALRRSSDLVREHTRQLFWNLLMLGLGVIVPMVAIAVPSLTFTHLAGTGATLDDPMSVTFRILGIVIPTALFAVVFLPMLLLTFQAIYENMVRVYDGPVAAAAGQRFTLYKGLSALGILLATGACAAGIIMNPELATSSADGQQAISGPARRGPADTDEVAKAGLEPNKTPPEATAKDRDWQRYQDVSSIRMALQQYANDNGGYPDSLETLIPTYMKQIPSDPLSYRYRYAKADGSFRIDFTLEEGIRALGAGEHVLSPEGFDKVAIAVSNTSTEGTGSDTTADLVPARSTQSGTARNIPDFDNDGVSDTAERALGTDFRNADSDDDGLIDSDEIEVFGTNPVSADSDADGTPDGEEIATGSNPTVPVQEDDGSTATMADSDNDGLADAYENSLGTNPFRPDSDNDGLADGDEVLVFGTDPMSPDTDGDGFSDGTEINAGTDPLVKQKTVGGGGGGGGAANTSGGGSTPTVTATAWAGRVAVFGLHQPTLSTLGFWHPSLPGLY